jgi:predicted acyltransferase
MNNEPKTKRLASLDALRGFDMLWIIGGERVIHALSKATGWEVFHILSNQFRHKEWEGFAFYDLIMPLFLFMVGMSIPFSLAKRKSLGQSSGTIYRHTVKRFVVLFILGMISQCHLLAFDPDKLFIIHDTLQAIAIGYLFSIIIYMNLKIRGQLVITVGLVVLYWAIMQFVPVPGHEAGTCTHQVNPARYLDRIVFGRFDDSPSDYTWLLSSLGFVATVMSGLFASTIIRAKSVKVPFSNFKNPMNHKALVLLLTGVALVGLGQVMNVWYPIIKRVWNASFILHSSGLSFILVAAFYWIIDVKGYQRWAFWLRVIGMNSIAIYMGVKFIPFHNIANRLLYGFKQFSEDWYPVLQSLGALLIIYVVMYWMYKKKTFIKV